MSKARALKNHNVSGLYTFALVGVFVILSMLLAVLGVNAYQNIIDRAQVANDARASVNYVLNKVRTDDTAGHMSVQEFDGHDMLVIEHRDEDSVYQTRIYQYEGTLREGFYDTEYEFYPEDGEKIIDILDFTLIQNQAGLLEMTITTADGRAHTSAAAIRSEA